MITYKYQRIEDGKIDRIVKNYQDEEVNISCIYNEMRGEPTDDRMRVVIIKGESAKSYDVPYMPIQEILLRGVDTEKMSNIIAKPDPKKKKTDHNIIINNIIPEDQALRLTIGFELFQGELFTYQENNYSEKWKIVENSNYYPRIQFTHNLRNSRLFTLMDNSDDRSAGKLFEVAFDKEGKTILPEAKQHSFYYKDIASKNFSIYPDKYTLEAVDDTIVILRNVYGGNSSFKLEEKQKQEYHAIFEMDDDKTVRYICFHRALLNQYGLHYPGEGKGFKETTEVIGKGDKVIEVTQVFEEITEKDFLRDLTKEEKKYE